MRSGCQLLSCRAKAAVRGLRAGLELRDVLGLLRLLVPASLQLAVRVLQLCRTLLRQAVQAAVLLSMQQLALQHGQLARQLLTAVPGEELDHKMCACQHPPAGS